MIEPSRIIRQRIDNADVLRSPCLVGCIGLKPIPQTKAHACGAAAAATVLRYLGKESNEYQCIEALRPSPVLGVDWWSLLKYLRKRGVRARAWCHYPVVRLIDNAREGIPTLLEWLDQEGHWVVCVGYDRASDALVFMDPAKPGNPFACFGTEAFERYWRAGGTGSRAYSPAVAIVTPLKTTEESLDYAKRTCASDRLCDWRTGTTFNRKRALATAYDD